MKHLFLYALGLSILFFGNVDAKDNTDDEKFNFPGGIIELRLEKQSDQIPDIKFGLASPVIIEYKDYWRVLIGVALDVLPGEYVMYYKPNYDGASGEYISLSVEQKVYPFTKHHANQTKELERAYQTHDSFTDLDYENTQQPSLPLSLPVEGTWSDYFGHVLFDDKTSIMLTPNALVLQSSEETVIRSPQNAIVSRVRTSQAGVSELILDHGRGLFSILSGVANLTVETGNGIVAGAVLGRLMEVDKPTIRQASTERTKLVWQTVVNGAYVNPMILIQLKP